MIPISCPGRVEGQESNGGSVHPEAFPHYQAVHDYANARGLEYAWERYRQSNSKLLPCMLARG